MNERKRTAPQEKRPCEAGDRPTEDHPQAQAAQWPGGGGAPETGDEDRQVLDEEAVMR